jgi:hypothetical protein
MDKKMRAKKLDKLKDLYMDKKLLHKYNKYITRKLSNIRVINIGCILTKNYILDFLIFYFSVVESWTFYPYLIHAFTFEKETYEKIRSFNLPNVQAHFHDIELERNWSNFTAMKVKMIELSGLDRCIISDIDALFLAETPELDILLDNHDFVFIGAPHSVWIIQASLWSFRRNRRTLRFAESWFRESLGRPYSDASGLPFALLKNRHSGLKIKALVLGKEGKKHHHKCPYDVQANIRPFVLTHDELGYREAEMGRAKVFHLGGLRPVKNETLEERMDRLNEKFPESKPIFGYYNKLALRAFQVMEGI